MSLIHFFQKRGSNGFGPQTTAEEVSAGLSLTDKVFLVTGCSSGIGQETARVLLLRGARVIACARTEQKAQEALQGSGVIPVACDLAEPTSVLSAVQKIQSLGLRLDGIIANAGIMALPRLELIYGYERQFFNNHMGHFLLIRGLLPLLQSDGRVVLLSSAAHRAAPRGGIDFENLRGEGPYRSWRAYGRSKFANLLFARELGRRLSQNPATQSQRVYAVHPGVIHTNLDRHMPAIGRWGYRFLGPLFLKTIPQGAATSVYAAVYPEVSAPTGTYFADCNPKAPRQDVESPAPAQRLWELSEQIARDLGCGPLLSSI